MGRCVSWVSHDNGKDVLEKSERASGQEAAALVQVRTVSLQRDYEHGGEKTDSQGGRKERSSAPDTCYVLTQPCYIRLMRILLI